MPVISENGRIDGIRVTIYHVMDFHPQYTVKEIAGILPLTVEQVQAAVDYIEANRAKVDPVYQKMLDRDAQGNSPEVRARAESIRPRFEAFCAEIRKNAAERRAAHDQVAD